MAMLLASMLLLGLLALGAYALPWLLGSSQPEQAQQPATHDEILSSAPPPQNYSNALVALHLWPRAIYMHIQCQLRSPL